MKNDGKDIEGGRCLIRNDRKFDFSEKASKRIWKNHMQEIMNKKNDWNHMTQAKMVRGLIVKVTREEMVIAIKAMKSGKAAGSSEVCAEMISGSGEVRIAVMIKL